MEKSLYFDYCAFLILAVMLISFAMHKQITGKVNRMFMYIIIVSIFTTCFDIAAVIWDGVKSDNAVIGYFFNCIYLILRNLQSVMYCFCLIAITDNWHNIDRKSLINTLMSLPFCVVCIATLSSPWTGFIFTMEKNGSSYNYIRGDGFVLLYISAAIYTIYALGYIISYSKIIEKRNMIPLLGVFPLLLIAVIIQYLKPDMLIEMFFNALGLLFIVLIVHRPDRRIDEVTELGKYSAYMNDLKRAFINKKPMRIIVCDIEKYGAIEEVLGYDNAVKATYLIAAGFVSLDKRLKLGAEMYYLGRGSYRVILDKEHFDKAEEAAEAISKASKKNITLKKVGIVPHTNVCLVRCPEDIDDFDSMIAFENSVAKRPYTGQVMYAAEVLKDSKYDIMKNIDVILERALKNNSFEVYYQPIYDVKNEKYNSAEALLRLKDKEYGFISPEIFIPAAEKNGNIHQIGNFVIETVCKFISNDDFSSLGLDYIEVNLSVAQCMYPGLADDIIGLMDKYGVSHDRINLEITETAVAYAKDVMGANIKKLSEAGIKFSLDDFGTGYSNMFRIASLPLKIVKIDKSFTKLEDNPKLEIVLRNSIKMIKDMNMKTVIEGVETKELANFFGNELDCEYIQGYYYSKPVPVSDFVQVVKGKNA